MQGAYSGPSPRAVSSPIRDESSDYLMRAHPRVQGADKSSYSSVGLIPIYRELTLPD